MDSYQLPSIIALLVLVVASILALQVWKKRKSPQREALRQRLRLITLYDEEKIDRLIEFEHDELERKGRHQESIENLMTRAIERWERDNASAAALY